MFDEYRYSSRVLEFSLGVVRRVQDEASALARGGMVHIHESELPNHSRSGAASPPWCGDDWVQLRCVGGYAKDVKSSFRRVASYT